MNRVVTAATVAHRRMTVTLITCIILPVTTDSVGEGWEEDHTFQPVGEERGRLRMRLLNQYRPVDQ